MRNYDEYFSKAKKPEDKILERNEVDCRKKKRSRTTFTQEQKDVLAIYFNETNFPDIYLREEISAKLGLSDNVIIVWFKNKRMKERIAKRKLKSKGKNHKINGWEDDQIQKTNQIHKNELNYICGGSMNMYNQNYYNFHYNQQYQSQNHYGGSQIIGLNHGYPVLFNQNLPYMHNYLHNDDYWSQHNMYPKY